MILVQVLVFALGAAGAARVVLSAIRTFVVPRGDNDALTRFVFRATRRLLNVVASPPRTYETRDRIM